MPHLLPLLDSLEFLGDTEELSHLPVILGSDLLQCRFQLELSVPRIYSILYLRVVT